MLIEAPDFEIGHDIEVLALQGDWDLKNQPGPSGGRWIIADPQRAHQACLTFMDRLAASSAQLAMLPELAIPRHTVVPIIQAVRALPRSLVFLGGVEGQTRQEYESLLVGMNGETQGLLANAPDNYVNALLIVVKTPQSCTVYLRAKRIPSGPENQGPPMAHGAGPFSRIRLGQRPLTIVPLVCSEFVWPDEVWAHLDKDVTEDIDFIPVLQHNLDAEAKHTGPQLHYGYTRTQTKQTRFIFVNQAISASCDGTCYVVVPPKSPGPPSFDHARSELWELPGGATYKGFRIPDLTGCIWSARITTPQAPTSALASPVCEGRVTEVLTPEAAPLRGLAVGLMRSAAVLVQSDGRRSSQTSVRDAVLNALDRSKNTYILRFLDTNSANEVFYQMQNTTAIEWSSVQDIVGGLIEGAALLASGGDDVVVAPCDAGNCRLAGRSLLVLYAPDVDEALTRRFPLSGDLDATPIPFGVLLIGIQSGTIAVGAQRIGDVLRADQVTSASADLADFPKKTEDSSVTIRLADVEFRSLRELKPNWKLGSSTAARDRLRDLFPKVYA